MLQTLPQVEEKIRELAAIMYAPDEFIPTFGYTTQTGLPHIELVDEGYALIVSEKGTELLRQIFKNPNALLFKVLEDISFSMAFESMAKDANYQNFKARLLQTQQNIIAKVNGFFMDTVTPVQDKVAAELVSS